MPADIQIGPDGGEQLVEPVVEELSMLFDMD